MTDLVVLERSAVEVLDREPTLDELAAIAKHEHDQVLVGVRHTLEHAIRAGEALLAAQRLVPIGEWGRWLDHHWSQRMTPTLYMRIAYNRDLVMEAGVTSVERARRMLQDVAPPRREAIKEHPRWKIDEAVRLRSLGMTNAQVAEHLEVPVNTVKGWMRTPDSRRRRDRKAKARRRREARLLRDQLRSEAATRAAKRAGGAIAEAYAMAERMQDVLGQAHREATDPERRRALAVAGQHYRQMRDEIVRALGVQ